MYIIFGVNAFSYIAPCTPSPKSAPKPDHEGTLPASEALTWTALKEDQAAVQVTPGKAPPTSWHSPLMSRQREGLG